MKPTKKVVNDVIAAMYERPETFKIDQYHLKDTKSGLSFWIANGANFCAVEAPFALRLGFVQGWRLMREVRRFQAWHAEKILAKA